MSHVRCSEYSCLGLPLKKVMILLSRETLGVSDVLPQLLMCAMFGVTGSHTNFKKVMILVFVQQRMCDSHQTHWPCCACVLNAVTLAHSLGSGVIRVPLGPIRFNMKTIKTLTSAGPKLQQSD